MPAFPGAHHICVTSEDCASFHTSACSRPPEPMTRSFIARIQATLWPGMQKNSVEFSERIARLGYGKAPVGIRLSATLAKPKLEHRRLHPTPSPREERTGREPERGASLTG